jgi:uncharacterized protein (DUF111 family)
VSESQRPDPESAQITRRGSIHFDRDVVAVLETNVDDVSGEILARTIERLYGEGVYDATVSTFLGKKGRPGNTIRVVCSRESVEKFAQLIVEETGTLGVKTTEYERLIVPRKTISVPVEIENFRGNVSVKIVQFRGRPIRIKPEWEEARQISDSQKIPLRVVLEQVIAAAKKFLSTNQADSLAT